MDPEHELYRIALAQIITSELVGGLHVRRVGELLVARERWNERVLAGKGQGTSRGMDDQFIDSAIMLEGKIVAAWYSCRMSNQERRHDVWLKNLVDALKEAADFFNRAAESWLDGK
jgi:hypothetical protein